MFISKVILLSLSRLLAQYPHLAQGNTLYRCHQLLWTLFPDTPKGEMKMLFRQEYDKPLGFIVVSEKAPVWDRELWEVQTKPYAPVFQVGDLLSFKLTANPVVTRDGQRHDVVMDAIKRGPAGTSNSTPDRTKIARKVGLDWIQKKGQKHGFEIVHSEAEFEGEKAQLNVTGYTQHRFEGHGKSIRLSTLDFDGVLRVTDPIVFREIVLQGLGPAKGFGCGLLLVRRLG